MPVLRRLYNKIVAVSALLIASALYLAGWESYKYTHPAGAIEKVVYKETKTEPVLRNYTAVPQGELSSHLSHYDTGTFNLFLTNINQRSGSIDMTLNGSLYQREASRDVSVPLASSGNWKFYAAGGIVLGTVVTAAITAMVK